MISKQDLERVVARDSNGREILSVFLDLSVNSDNKRTHQIFLNQRRAQFDELDSERESHPREDIGRAFKQLDNWLDTEFREENRGAAIYAELGGDWFEAFQFPVSVANRMVIAKRPAIAPLAQVIDGYQHHGVVLLDRERLRILSVYLGTLLDEIRVETEPFPTPRDVQVGGYSQMRYQRSKREEIRHFFREFAKEVDEFVHRYQPRDLVILGTEENVALFREFLSGPVTDKILFTGRMRVDEAASEILSRIRPHIEAEREKESRELLLRLRERVDQDYLAVAGFNRTLVALQEGKVDTLVLARDQSREGTRCTRCGFVFAGRVEKCPFDGASMESGVDLTEEVVRLAEAQDAEVQFVAAGELGDLAGVGALLRF